MKSMMVGPCERPGFHFKDAFAAQQFHTVHLAHGCTSVSWHRDSRWAPGGSAGRRSRVWSPPAGRGGARPGLGGLQDGLRAGGAVAGTEVSKRRYWAPCSLASGGRRLAPEIRRCRLRTCRSRWPARHPAGRSDDSVGNQARCDAHRLRARRQLGERAIEIEKKRMGSCQCGEQLHARNHSRRCNAGTATRGFRAGKRAQGLRPGNGGASAAMCSETPTPATP